MCPPVAGFETVQAIYFDLDDTLCAYWEAAKEGLRDAFDQHPIPGKSTREMLGIWAVEFRRFARELKSSEWYDDYLTQGGVTRARLIYETLCAAGIEDRDLADQISDTYGRERDRRLSLFPEAADVLRVLHGRFPLGLITNGPADVQRQEIETLGIKDYFDHVFIEGELRIGKPHAVVMEKAEAAVGLTGASLLFVGNSYSNDILPAIERGWRTVWIRRPTDVPPSSRTGKPEERPEGSPLPDAETDDLRDLLRLLGLN